MLCVVVVMKNVSQSILRKSGCGLEGMGSGVMFGGGVAAGVLAGAVFFLSMLIVNQSPREALKSAY